MIIEFIDSASGIRLNLLDNLERFSDSEIRHVKSLTGQTHIDSLERFLIYLRADELKLLKNFVNEFNELKGGEKI